MISDVFNTLGGLFGGGTTRRRRRTRSRSRKTMVVVHRGSHRTGRSRRQRLSRRR